MTETELAAKLATIAATQEHSATALETLTAEVRAARLDDQARQIEVSESLGRISTEIATTKIKLSNHIRSNDQRIETLWRALKWLAGMIVTGGTVAGTARIAEAVF